MVAQSRAIIALLVAGLLLLAATASAQGSGVIEGFVRDRFGNPIAGAKVVLKGPNGMDRDRTQTDREGHYLFSDLVGATYFVSVELEGSQPEVHRVQAFDGESTFHLQEDFSMDNASPAGLGAGDPPFQQDVPADAKEFYQQGVDDLKNNRHDQALASFESALLKFPDYFDALRMAGMEYMLRGNAAKAGQACQRAVTLNKNSASARFCLGWAFYQAEKVDEASRELSEASKLNPRAAETLWFLGMTELERKQWSSAEKAFGAFKKLHPKDDRPLLYLYLTSVYDGLGRSGDAVRALETYLKLVPEKERTQKLKELLARLKNKR